jgi:hypothetical protein
MSTTLMGNGWKGSHLDVMVSPFKETSSYQMEPAALT